MRRRRKDKFQVYGEYGGSFTNMDFAKACAKEASKLEETKEASVYLISDGCSYVDYVDGKLKRDGWTLPKKPIG